MKTVLIVTPDSALRSRLLRVFSDASTFLAPNDSEALKTLRLVDVEVIFRDGRSPLRALSAFVAHVKELTPTVQVVAIGPGDEEAEAADFALPAAFSQHDLDATVRHLDAKQRLIREVTALRAQPPPAPMIVPGEETARETPALARVLKEFSRVLAAGFNLPRVLDMFLDAIGEFLRPTRSALLLRYVEDLPWDEIGRLVGLSREAVKKRLLRGRAELRARLGGAQ